jgi:hypothetical protein
VAAEEVEAEEGRMARHASGDRAAGLPRRWNRKPGMKDTGFVRPPRPHVHWHGGVSYVNVSGTFYYL